MGLLPILALTFLQTPPTLAHYLQAHPEDGGLVVGAENAKEGKDGSGLARYGRKRVTVGGLKVVVPLTMVRFEESPAKPPSLTDGLPRDAKVLYLLTTLSPGQWQKANGTGLGLGDLQGEQKDVFLSILPKRFEWMDVRADADHGWGPIVGRGALDEKARQGVRLRLQQSLQISVEFTDGKSSTSQSPDFEMGKPGQVVRMRDKREDDETESYGVPIRSDAPNLPKKGELDTSALNASVTLSARTTVGEALRLVGAATGREILADLRVRDLSLSAPAKVRAGDLLDALALSVSGTYRRLGGTTLLVADVVGAGTRKLRYLLWKEALDAETERRKSAWTAALAKGGQAQRTGFPDDPLYAATPETARRLAAPRGKSGMPEYFPASELSPEQREMIDRLAAREKDRQIDTTKAFAMSSLRYRFVLPDGTALQAESSLGLMERFAPPKPRSPSLPFPVVPKGANAPDALRALVVRTGNPDEAKRAASVAKRFGFGELWIETERPEILTAATGGGLPVRLFARPWALPPSGADSDRTVLGETGRALGARQARDPAWLMSSDDVRSWSYPFLPFLFQEGDLMSPSDPRWPARRNALTALAKTPGLAGVVLTEVTPHGYEDDAGNVNLTGYSRSLVEAWGFGYDERARLAFFRANGYDPVDLSSEGMDLGVEMMDTPAFPKYPARPLALVREAYQKWEAFRAKANLTALAELRRDLGHTNVVAEMRRAHGWIPPRGDRILALWPAGEIPPTYDDQYAPRPPENVHLVSAPATPPGPAMADFDNAVKYLAPDPKQACAFDLTRVPSGAWETLLGRLLFPR